MLVRDFIPCYRISDGVIGLYDKVSGKFYTNAGTGTFTKGADVGSGFDEIVGIGQSSQDSTQGYNLLSSEKANQSSSLSITYISGARYNCKTTSSGNQLIFTGIGLPSGNYVVSIQVTRGTYSGGNFVVRNSSNSIIGEGAINGTNRLNITISNNDINSLLLWGASANLDFDFDIQISSGTTAQNFEKYTGGQASPNPSYPQEIKYVRGRNLFNKDKTPENYYIDGSGGKVYVSNNDFINQEYSLRGEVTISFTNKSSNSAYVRVCEYNGSTFIRRTLVSASGTYPLSTNCDRVIFSVDNSESVYFTNLQIEEGTQTTPYLPYNTIEEVVSGKNLFVPVLSIDGTNIGVNNSSLTQVINGEFSFVASGSDLFFGNVRNEGTAYEKNRGIKIYRNGNSKISYRCSNDSFNKNFFTAYDKNDISLGYTMVGSSGTGTYTFPDNCEYVTFRFGNGAAVSGTTYKTKVIVAYGDTIPDYEPYKTPKTYQLSLGDYEFHGIGDYKDKILCDLENEKVYKYEKIGKVVLNGSENIVKGEDIDYIRFEVRGVIPLMIQNTNRTECLSNYFHFLQSGRGVGVCFTYWIYDGSIYIYPQQTITQVDDMKAWLSSNQPIFYYILATPTLTEITGTLKDQIIAWCKAHSTNETTIIEMDGDLPLLIEVRGLKGAA